MEKINLFRKFVGCMYGIAVGDAFAFPVKYKTRERIFKEYGPNGVVDIVNSGRSHITDEGAESFKGTYSDYTQLSIAVTKCLLKSNVNSIDDLMENLSRELIEWKNSPENNRSQGNGYTKGIKNLEKGINWEFSGAKDSYGCGAAIRAAPIGLAFHDDLEKLKEVAAASAICTHNSRVAIASAIANAYLVSMAVKKQDPSLYVENLLSFTEGISEDFTRKIAEIKELMNLPPEIALKKLGTGLRGDEAVACALYCALKNGFDFKKSIIMAANIDGDSCSASSIAGGITGAYMGRYAIPTYFERHLENRQLLFDLVKGLYQKFAGKK